MKMSGERAGTCARSPSRGRRAGFSIIEIVIAVMLLTLSIGAVTSTLATTDALSRANAERARAFDSIESKIEQMLAGEPSDVFARFNADPADDLDPSDPGHLFHVAGLTPRRTDADGFVGEISFPGNGFELREDVDDIELGMRRDLSGDGLIDSADHGDDYSILPVRVSVDWIGISGNQHIEAIVVVSER